MVQVNFGLQFIWPWLEINGHHPTSSNEGMAKIWKDLQYSQSQQYESWALTISHKYHQTTHHSSWLRPSQPSSHHPAHWRSPCFLQRTFGTLPQQTSANMDCAVNWQNGQTNPWTIFKTHTQTNDNKWISIKTRWLQLVATINSLS